MYCYAFISYQTADKQIAGRIKELLESIGITSFLAHEDIDVSEEWSDVGYALRTFFGV